MSVIQGEGLTSTPFNRVTQFNPRFLAERFFSLEYRRLALTLPRCHLDAMRSPTREAECGQTQERLIDKIHQ